jgi:hypothetical protein
MVDRAIKNKENKKSSVISDRNKAEIGSGQ